MDNIILSFLLNEEDEKNIDNLLKLKNNFNEEDLIKRYNDIISFRKELLKLKELPLIKQRTKEWYKLRENRLTASDLYEAINSKSEPMNLIKKKANLDKDKETDTCNYNKIPALKWGTMYEAMASRCYSQKYNNIPVYEFGLIADTSYEHFGASPDGINELGIMLEIKCPYSREIKEGVIPDKYISQIQGQLSVCNLKECDYIECVFKEYDFKEYLNIIEEDDKINHGIIAEYITNDKKEYKYLYSNEYLNKYETTIDIVKQINENKPGDCYFNKLIYWKLEKMLIQKVYFDEEKWKDTKTKIVEFWDKVEKYKKNPISPKKKSMFIQDDE